MNVVDKKMGVNNDNNMIRKNRFIKYKMFLHNLSGKFDYKKSIIREFFLASSNNLMFAFKMSWVVLCLLVFHCCDIQNIIFVVSKYAGDGFVTLRPFFPWVRVFIEVFVISKNILIIYFIYFLFRTNEYQKIYSIVTFFFEKITKIELNNFCAFLIITIICVFFYWLPSFAILCSFKFFQFFNDYTNIAWFFEIYFIHISTFIFIFATFFSICAQIEIFVTIFTPVINIKKYENKIKKVDIFFTSKIEEKLNQIFKKYEGEALKEVDQELYQKMGSDYGFFNRAGKARDFDYEEEFRDFEGQVYMYSFYIDVFFGDELLGTMEAFLEDGGFVSDRFLFRFSDASDRYDVLKKFYENRERFEEKIYYKKSTIFKKAIMHRWGFIGRFYSPPWNKSAVDLTHIDIEDYIILDFYKKFEKFRSDFYFDGEEEGFYYDYEDYLISVRNSHYKKLKELTKKSYIKDNYRFQVRLKEKSEKNLLTFIKIIAKTMKVYMLPGNILNPCVNRISAIIFYKNSCSFFLLRISCIKF